MSVCSSNTSGALGSGEDGFKETQGVIGSVSVVLKVVVGIMYRKLQCAKWACIISISGVESRSGSKVWEVTRC